MTTQVYDNMNKPWEQLNMTESEYHEYQTEYANWLDSLKEPA